MKQIKMIDGKTFDAELFTINDGVLSIRLHEPMAVLETAKIFSKNTESITLIEDDGESISVNDYVDLIAVFCDRYSMKPMVQLQKEAQNGTV